ncbi:hypothetical protein CIN_04260 [Commensalibacter intestini A911]|uniref:Phosphoribosyltransferase domain-containing protein n=1 Tax=Commensalibacter intestini A911 TaxID=1088868 RepID=G6EYA6_9PROT|nr:hypothetical protein [Commensalibacter intestini]EHD14494.1 hypothetical protein CIN_04260 [Commensalibacter intestini A911]
MAKLKAVIFSVRNVFFDDRLDKKQLENKYTNPLMKFINFLSTRNIKVIIHSNTYWYVDNNKDQSLANYFKSKTEQDIQDYNSKNYPNMPKKPRADAVPFILKNENLQPNEVIYIGANENDWKACINSKMLFIKATWILNNKDIKYGLYFEDTPALARFIDICCIQANKKDMYHYQDDHINLYTLSPFSTLKPQLAQYSASARSTAKQLGNEALPDFWLMLLISKIYFSGLYLQIKNIIAFPGHKVGSGNEVMDKALDIFSKCFRITYLPNALIRHTQSTKSQDARNNGNKALLSIYNHLNTLMLNNQPKKGLYGNECKNNYHYQGKTTLLIDDIVTAGYSFDAAKLLLEAAGAKVICLAWLKTINTDLIISKNKLPTNYSINRQISDSKDLFPHPNSYNIPYTSIIKNNYDAGNELDELFTKFTTWNFT